MRSVFSSREERLAAFRRAKLYLVISSEFTLDRPVPEVFEAAAAGGIRLIQLREKNKGAKFLYDTAVACRPIAEKYGVMMMIDDMVDVALLCGADGVHLGQDDLPVDVARRIAPDLFLGCSTHNLAEALAAKAAGADYINIGPVYDTATKALPMKALGVDAVRRIAPAVSPLPFSVMGGVKEHRFTELYGAGARLFAMVTEITRAPDVRKKVEELMRAYGAAEKGC